MHISPVLTAPIKTLHFGKIYRTEHMAEMMLDGVGSDYLDLQRGEDPTDTNHVYLTGRAKVIYNTLNQMIPKREYRFLEHELFVLFFNLSYNTPEPRIIEDYDPVLDAADQFFRKRIDVVLNPEPFTWP